MIDRQRYNYKCQRFDVWKNKPQPDTINPVVS